MSEELEKSMKERFCQNIFFDESWQNCKDGKRPNPHLDSEKECGNCRSIHDAINEARENERRKNEQL